MKTTDLQEAKQRAERAKRYVEMYPEFIYPGDLKFQTVEWQLEQVKRFKRACAPQK
jgi:hypothetical protein